MIELEHPRLSITRQCALVSLSRSSYYEPVTGEPAENLELMLRGGLQAVYQRPKTTVPHPEHKIRPSLLRDMVIDRPNQVWCADITYIPMRRGFLYLVAVMDWATRRVLAW